MSSIGLVVRPVLLQYRNILEKMKLYTHLNLFHILRSITVEKDTD